MPSNSITEAEREYFRQYALKHKEKIKAYQAEYRQRNLEKLKAASRARHHANKQERAAKKKEYYEANKERLKAASREWGKAHPEEVKAKADAWVATHPERAAEMRRKAQKRRYSANPEKYRESWRARRARKLEIGGSHTESDIHAIYNAQCGFCAGCETELNGKYEVDHIMPIFLGGSDNPENLQLLCRRCNRSKGYKHPDEWRATLKKSD